MDNEISLLHGAGGEAYRELVREVFLPAYGSAELSEMGDSALVDGTEKLAFTTDGFVVSPLEFPGGDVGSLAVSGTVNDIAVSGAVPRYLSVSMILEAGLPVETLRRVAQSIACTAREAGVRVVTGDTKVVEKGRADGIYITTAGIGTLDGPWEVPPQQVETGDILIVSGPIASHGMAVMAAREKLDFEPPILSDARPLNGAIRAVLETGLPVHALRDPTRGGLGATLCEWARDGIDIVFEEARLPVLPGVAAVCRMLGIEPIFVANEGVFLLSAPEAHSEELLEALRAHPDGRHAEIIGKITAGKGQVLMETELGTRRRVLMPRGEILPRIC